MKATHKTGLLTWRAALWSAAAVLILAWAGAARAAEPVTVSEDDVAFTLSNGLLTTQIDKLTGNILSLRYAQHDLLKGGRGYWSFVGGNLRPGPHLQSVLRQDPARNEGALAEVSCTFGYDGKPGTLPVDLELRYQLARAGSAITVYAVWRHPAAYPGFSLAEGRYALKLNAGLFDFLSVDKERQRLMPTGEDWDRGVQLNLKEVRRLTSGIHTGEVEHKYDYSAVLSEVPAYGWSSTRAGVGLWVINPSLESFGGGPTKVELTGHLDVNSGGTPTLLNMWLGSHYGGSALGVAAGENWNKVIGPFEIYCNSGAAPEAMWKDAVAYAHASAQKGPVETLNEPLYPGIKSRGAARGRFILSDPLAPRESTLWKGLWVGVSAPDYAPERLSREAPPVVSWQRDAKSYQFWSQADSQGHFEIKAVRPGHYTLHAFADGILGEYSQTELEIKAGQTLDLGTLTWRPQRYGRQLWEIGVPNRSAAEFRHGELYWKWGLYLDYPKEFPEDVRFTIGQSDWSRDWNYCQPPRLDAGGHLEESTWRIFFDLKEVPRGPLTLRLAFCGSRAGQRVMVGVNGAPVGDSGELFESGVVHRDGIRGLWDERKVSFESKHLVPGRNEIELRARAQSWHHAVVYDYLRLEAAE